MTAQKLFTEFPNVSDSEWEKQILSDLKGADYAEKMIWKTAEGFDVKPYYTINNQQGGKPLFTHTSWNNIVAVSTAKAAETALANAANGVKYIGEDLAEFKKIVAVSGSNPVLLPNVKLAELPQTTIFLLINIAEVDLIAQKLVKGFRVMVYTTHSGNATEKLATLINGLHEVIKKAGSRYFGNVSVSYTVEKNYFVEIAALRALRVLWYNMLKAYDTIFDLHIHAEAMVYAEDEKEPYKNMLSNTTEAMSAIVGGSNSICLTPHDCQINDDFSARIARNISTVLKEESYLDKVADIGAGSYYIETITAKLAEEVWKRC